MFFLARTCDRWITVSAIMPHNSIILVFTFELNWNNSHQQLNYKGIEKGWKLTRVITTVATKSINNFISSANPTVKKCNHLIITALLAEKSLITHSDCVKKWASHNEGETAFIALQAVTFDILMLQSRLSHPSAFHLACGCILKHFVEMIKKLLPHLHNSRNPPCVKWLEVCSFV